MQVAEARATNIFNLACIKGRQIKKLELGLTVLDIQRREAAGRIEAHDRCPSV